MKQSFLSIFPASFSDIAFQKEYDPVGPTRARLQRVVSQQGYITPECSLNLPFDSQLLHAVEDLATRKKRLDAAGMVVVGIGGSNLGIMAVYHALYGRQGNPDFCIWWADTVDTDQIAALLKEVEKQIKEGKKVLMALISKSGTTTETVANGSLFLELFKCYFPHNYHEYIVVITDSDSVLWQLAVQEKCDYLEIPRLVGGRYSVLSAVGLFPLACAGIDVRSLQEGARDMVIASLDAESDACRSAIMIAHYYAKGYVIHDLFIFDAALESYGRWYRQLMGESIGKEKKVQGKRVPVGITPTVSIGSTDLHSVGQLYLGGPWDKVTTFIDVANPQSMIKIPDNSLSALLDAIPNKSLHEIMKAIVQGTKTAYQQQGRPCMSITLEQKNAYYIGGLLQYSMVQMIYLGALLEVNPFDQPHVELYKTQTRKILAHE